MTDPSAPAETIDRVVAVKGHGTQNDFVVVLDPDDRLPWLGPRSAAAICDRRSGVGADGLIRAVRTSGGAAPWSMDYWNCDGTSGLMCGNGIRVMAEMLSRARLLPDDAVAVATRSGTRSLTRRAPGVWAVDMGLVTVGIADGSAADAAPGDSEIDTLVAAPGLRDLPRPGLRVDVGNPHVVVAVTGLDELADISLRHAPALRPETVGGVNVEFVAVLGTDTDAAAGPTGRLAMRVYERGSGETRSCGTGAVAAAVAAATWAGPGAPTRWSVDVPGGQLEVELGDRGAVLVGPAVVVADVQLDPQWLAASQA